LRETLEGVHLRLGRKSATDARIVEKETLLVPDFALNVVRNYQELIGKKFINPPWAGLPLVGARQTIRFLLNEHGARLASEAEWQIGNGHSAPPPKPRRFVLDRPFLLYLKEKQAGQPYFVLWAENAELMVRP
jgi:hypothetical protein